MTNEAKTVKERPILFTARMVRAVLDGRKTVTRRAVNDRLYLIVDGDETTGRVVEQSDPSFGERASQMARCKYGQVGERLWVKETWQPTWAVHDQQPASLAVPDGWKISYVATSGRVEYQDADDGLVSRCKPAIFMRRWMSRITLEIVDVRVERLHDITEEECEAEGIDISPDGVSAYYDDKRGGGQLPSARAAFEHLWSEINGRKSWDSNPWIWRIEFRRLTQEGVRHVA